MKKFGGPVLRNDACLDITVEYEEKHKIVWIYMNASPRQCFTLQMLQSILLCLNDIKRQKQNNLGPEVRYAIIASKEKGIFNLGGDLDLFYKFITEGNQEGLLNYAITCIDVLYTSMTHLESNLTTISLVQGEALGGGFEGALSANVVIAENGVSMGFPEILFNLFPGMGAYNLLTARAGCVNAERIILSGQRYSAEHLSQMGIIDILAEKGEGKSAVYSYIKRADRSPTGYAAIRQIRDRYNNISYEDLLQTVHLWVDTALSLRQKDLRMMKRLIDKQSNKNAII